MSRISILDQWKFQNGTNFRMQQLRQNQITPSRMKQMIASERSQSTGQHMKRPFLSIPATSGGLPRNYDEAINDMEYGIELENVLVEQDQLKGTEEPRRVPFDFKLSQSVKSELIKAINKLIKESQYIFSGEIDTIKYVNIFKEFNNMSFTYNEYVDDIKQDAEFLQLWHTKLANLDSIFIKVKQRLHDLANGNRYGDNILVVTGAYQTDYIIGILDQLIEVINMMMLNKNTTQYLAVENKPLTEITKGQVESEPQYADPDETEEQRIERERREQEDRDRETEEERLDRERREEEGKRREEEGKRREESDEDRIERERREFEEEERKRQEEEDEAMRIAEEEERKRREEEELERARKEEEDILRRGLADEIERQKRKLEIIEQKIDDEDGTAEELEEMKQKYQKGIREKEEREAELATFEAEIKALETPKKKDDEEGSEERKSDEVVPMTPMVEELSESQTLNKNYYDKVYTTDQQYLEYVRDKLAPFIYKNKPTPAVKADRGTKINTAKLRQFPSSGKGDPINTTFFSDYIKKLKTVYDTRKVNPITSDLIKTYNRAYGVRGDFAPRFVPNAEAALL